MGAWHAGIEFDHYGVMTADDVDRRYHVRCDEERPICRRCARLGRRCEWDNLKSALSSDILTSSDELRHYQYYREKISCYLDGAFTQVSEQSTLSKYY